MDIARATLGSDVSAYAIVFACEALLFVAAARMAARTIMPAMRGGAAVVKRGPTQSVEDVARMEAAT